MAAVGLGCGLGGASDMQPVGLRDEQLGKVSLKETQLETQQTFSNNAEQAQA